MRHSVAIGFSVFVVFFFGLASNSWANEPICSEGVCKTRYNIDFFQPYAPVTALDLVNNLPGFRLNNGNSSTRGFSEAAGNILIDGIRLSTKSESPSEQLRTIPAQTVVAIEILRGNLGQFDLGNQSVAANIIRKQDISGSGTLELTMRQWQPSEKVKPRVEVNYASSFRDIDYNVNVLRTNYEWNSERQEPVTNGQGRLIEGRDEYYHEDGKFLRLSMGANTEFAGTKLNAKFQFEEAEEDGGLTSLRTPISSNAFEAFFVNINARDNYEFSFDAERNIGANIAAKLIAITQGSEFTGEGGLTRTFSAGEPTRESVSTTQKKEREDIVRLEFDYLGWQQNQVQLSIEGTVNELKSDFSLLANNNGELVPVHVAGAVTDIKEERLDIRLTNAFSMYGVNIEASLGAEDSTITQTGGFEASRSFFYFKPSLTLSKSLENNRQIQARIFRKVGQLDFDDFTSSVDLDQDELALGNPELEPEKITTIDFRYEQSFGEIGTVNITLFHDMIEGVDDLLPLGDNLEVPGNIGDGSRTGIKADFTVPIDIFGLRNARLDGRFTLQDSNVDDPVTGKPRLLSNFEQWEYDFSFRQDLTKHRVAWGFRYFTDDYRGYFGLDEFTEFGKEYMIALFAEKRFGNGVKLRLDIENINRKGEGRNRTLYEGRRGASPILLQERRETRYPRRLILALSKTF